MTNEFYVYVLFRPDGTTPCYVGKGKGHRWKVHEQGRYSHKNTHLAAIIKRAGGSLPKQKIAEGLSEDEAFALERKLIAEYGRGKNGSLVNLTDGGDGTSGLIISAERRAAISLQHKGKTISPEHKVALAQASKNREWSAESREKSRQSKLGTKKSPEEVARMKKRKPSQLAREAVAEANRQRIWTTEMRRKTARANAKRRYGAEESLWLPF